MMTIGALILGGAIGMLIGGTMAYDKGFKAGVSWCQAKVFGH
jgi:hypothetical protein